MELNYNNYGGMDTYSDEVTELLKLMSMNDLGYQRIYKKSLVNVYAELNKATDRETKCLKEVLIIEENIGKLLIVMEKLCDKNKESKDLKYVSGKCEVFKKMKYRVKELEMKKNEPNKRYIELKEIRKFLEVKKDKIAKEGNENVNEFCNLGDKLELLMDEAWKKKEVSAKTSRISINWMQVEEWTKVIKYKPIRVERLEEPLKKFPMKKSLVKRDQGGESVLKQLRQKTNKNAKKKK